MWRIARNSFYWIKQFYKDFIMNEFSRSKLSTIEDYLCNISFKIDQFIMTTPELENTEMSEKLLEFNAKLIEIHNFIAEKKSKY